MDCASAVLPVAARAAAVAAAAKYFFIERCLLPEPISKSDRACPRAASWARRSDESYRAEPIGPFYGAYGGYVAAGQMNAAHGGAGELAGRQTPGDGVRCVYDDLCKWD